MSGAHGPVPAGKDCEGLHGLDGEPLPERDARALIRLSAALAGGDETRIRGALVAATGVVSGAAVEEALLQSYLFLGFPAALSGLSIWREVSGRPAAPESTPGGPTEWAQRGEGVCRRVYGEAYDKLRDNVRLVHPALDRWMIVEGYGKVLGRPGLDLSTREACIVAILARTARPAQLHSHLRGALHAGASPERVRYALDEGLRLAASPAWTAQAVALWETVRERVGSRPPAEE